MRENESERGEDDKIGREGETETYLSFPYSFGKVTQYTVKPPSMLSDTSKWWIDSHSRRAADT